MDATALPGLPMKSDAGVASDAGFTDLLERCATPASTPAPTPTSAVAGPAVAMDQIVAPLMSSTTSPRSWRLDSMEVPESDFSARDGGSGEIPAHDGEPDAVRADGGESVKVLADDCEGGEVRADAWPAAREPARIAEAPAETLGLAMNPTPPIVPLCPPVDSPRRAGHSFAESTPGAATGNTVTSFPLQRAPVAAAPAAPVAAGSTAVPCVRVAAVDTVAAVGEVAVAPAAPVASVPPAAPFASVASVPSVAPVVPVAAGATVVSSVPVAAGGADAVAAPEGFVAPETFAQAAAASEKFAATIRPPLAREERLVADSRNNKFLNADEQSDARLLRAHGTGRAKPLADMQATTDPIPAQAALTPPRAVGMGADTVPFVAPSSASAAITAPPAPTAGLSERRDVFLPATDATAVVRELQELTHEVRFRERGSVEVKFDFQDATELSVRLAYRGGDVHAIFRTDSEELRDALGREWQGFIASSARDPGSPRIADPVFTAANDFTGSPSDRDAGSTAGGDARDRWQSSRPDQPGSPSHGHPVREFRPHAPALGLRVSSDRLLHAFA